jgi:hypothetical protein
MSGKVFIFKVYTKTNIHPTHARLVKKISFTAGSVQFRTINIIFRVKRNL